MISNLKVDVIYYNTSSDFELEFNLSGCCRMRIFKEKIEGRKNLVNALARDVARSRVILIVTDLIGDKNGVETVSSAIGFDYEDVDKSACSIISEDNIKAPHGALPLVTKSGKYGGCIVECGNQSIIFVSSDRALRHEIMHSYIHQYVFDINQIEEYNERLRHEQSDNPIIENSNILNNARREFISATVELSDNKESENINEAALEQPEQVLSENDEAIAEDTSCDNENIADDSIEVVLKTDDDDIIRSSSTGFVAKISDEEETLESDENIDTNLPRKRKGTDIALLIIMILLLVGFSFLAYFFVYMPITTGSLPNNFVEVIKSLTGLA